MKLKVAVLGPQQRHYCRVPECALAQVGGTLLQGCCDPRAVLQYSLALRSFVTSVCRAFPWTAGV